MSRPARDPVKPGTWAPEQLIVARQSPRELATVLAVTCSDLPGFDNADRAWMRRVAVALTRGDDTEAMALALSAVDARAGCGYRRARPEAVQVEAVLWLLARSVVGDAAVHAAVAQEA